MARNPFGHTLQEDAEAQLASVLGGEGAKRAFENMDARLSSTASELTEALKLSKPLSDKGKQIAAVAQQIAKGVKFKIKGYTDEVDQEGFMGPYVELRWMAPMGFLSIMISEHNGHIAIGTYGVLPQHSYTDVKQAIADINAWLGATPKPGAKPRPHPLSGVYFEGAHEPVDDLAEGIETGVRYEVINYEPGDFGGMEKSFGQFSVSVSGNTFPIKDELKKLGLRFNPKTKTWDLVSRYAAWGSLTKGSVAHDVVKKAIPKVKDLVDAFNEKVKTQNQQSLAGMGVSDDPQPTDIKGQIKSIMSLQRTNERLKKLGIAIAYDFPESIGGFHNAGSYTAWVVGDTFKVKDQLNKFGFRFNRMVPSKVKDQAKGLKVQAGWSMDGATFDRIDKQVKQTLIRASEGTL